MNERRTYIPKNRIKKPGATPVQKRISWSQGMKNKDIINILQCKLMEARAPHPQRTEVDLLPELVHEIKHRLTEYDLIMGDLPKSKRRPHEELEDDGDGVDGDDDGDEGDDED